MEKPDHYNGQIPRGMGSRISGTYRVCKDWDCAKEHFVLQCIEEREIRDTTPGNYWQGILTTGYKRLQHRQSSVGAAHWQWKRHVDAGTRTRNMEDTGQLNLYGRRFCCHLHITIYMYVLWLGWTQTTDILWREEYTTYTSRKHIWVVTLLCKAMLSIYWFVSGGHS